MKTQFKLALTLIAGAVIGGAAVQGIHAQSKPPVYIVAEIDVTNPDAYAKEYVPKAIALNKAAGVRYIALGGKTTSLEGVPVKQRVVIQVWDSLEQAQAVRNSANYKEARKIGEKFATFRTYAVEGVAH